MTASDQMWSGPPVFSLEIETTADGTTILSPDYPGLLIFERDIAAAFNRVPWVVATIHKLENSPRPRLPEDPPHD